MTVQHVFDHYTFCPFIAPTTQDNDFRPIDAQEHLCYAVERRGSLLAASFYLERGAGGVADLYLTILFRYGIFGGGKS